MTEHRLSFLHRFYGERNSFNWFLGAGYHSFSMELGSRWIPQASGFTMVRIQTLGLEAGLGNRWQFESGWVVGVDWFSMHLPIHTIQADMPYLEHATNDSDKRLVRRTTDVIKHLPTFSVFKVQVGLAF